MLVLSRKRDEKIIIGENITITIVAIAGRSVRVGIDAPKDVPVNREETIAAPGRVLAMSRGEGMPGAHKRPSRNDGFGQPRRRAS